MNFSQIRVFREVMETGSLSEAARNLGRTQPAVSLALKSLEENLGLQLFERRGRRLVPAPEAHYLHSEATEVLDRLKRTSRAISSMSDAASGHLAVAAMPGPSLTIFPRFINGVLETSTDITASLLTRSSTQIRELVRSQTIDFAFADHDDLLAASDQFHEEIITGDCVLAMARDHPLAEKAEIGFEDLHEIQLGRMQPDSPLDRKLEAALTAVNARPLTRVRSQTILPLLQFVAAGHCAAVLDPLTLVSDGMTSNLTPGLELRPFRDPLRYAYVTLTPSFRPLSKTAKRVRDEWTREVADLVASPMG